MFVDELSRFAAELGDPRVTGIVEQVAAPPRIGMAGRPGVGRRTVACALRGAGIAVTADVPDAPAGSGAEVDCYVLAEAVKPEDVAAVAAAAAAARPVLVVLNKSDVPAGADPAAVSVRIGAPVVPVAAVFAVAAGDDRLDAGVRSVLRRLSGIDAVVERLLAAEAGVRYRRVLAGVARLEALSVDGGRAAGRIARFLSADATVLARMADAAALAGAVGLDGGSCGGPEGGPADDPGDRLARAVGWRRRSTAPLSVLHRACANDLARGALRLWSAGAP